MKIECTQENLARAIQLVSRMVGTRGTLPVLGNILLSIERGRLKVAATDLEMGIQTWIGGKVESEGALTVPARLFADFILTNTDPTIILEVKETTLHLKSHHYTANIKGIDAAEFPLIPQIKRDYEITLKSNQLKTAIQQVVFATAVDETRPVLTGVLVKINNNSLKLVATDSYRLAEKTIPLTKENNQISVIIPARTLQELGRILPDQETDINFYISENQILFVFSETELISRLIDGTFPDYEQIIPKKTLTTLALKRPQFMSVMKMASFFARESANNVQFKITESQVQVTAVSPQLGDTISELEAEISGEPLEIAFNSKFILDALNIFPSDEIQLMFSGKLQAGVLKQTQNKDDYLYLIMPLRVDV